MDIKDKIRIALRNLAAGKHMVTKIIFGMAFVFMLIFSSLMVVVSFFSYTKEYNQKNIADCYYYVEYENLDIRDTSGILEYSQKQRYYAKEVSMFATIQLCDQVKGLIAGDTKLILGEEEYQIDDFFIFNRKPYQNIYGETAPIELALYEDNMFMLGEQKIFQYGDNFLLGDYPRNPGEIMLDTYILDAYGIQNIEENLLGQKVSIYFVNEQSEEIVLKDYILTGILQERVLSLRESLYTSDYHFEHIYVNLSDEDVERFIISRGSVRYYFGDYAEYVEHYEHKSDLLKLDMSQIEVSNDNVVRLTEKGIMYYLLHWIMSHIGKLLILVAIVIVLVNTISVFYIFQFYRDRNIHYISMLYNIGMTKIDRKWIFSLEIFFIMIVAMVLGFYASTVLISFTNFITRQVIDFNISMDISTSILAMLIGYLYFGVGLWIIMKKQT